MLQHLGHLIVLRVRRNELNVDHHQIGIVLDLAGGAQLHDDDEAHGQKVRHHRHVTQQPIGLQFIDDAGGQIVLTIVEHLQQQPQPDDGQLSAVLAGRRETAQKVLEHLARRLLFARFVDEQFLQVGEQFDVALIFARAERVCVRQQKLAQTLHRQMVEVAVAVLHEIGQPWHRLRRALSLDDVQQQIGRTAAAQQMAELVAGVEHVTLFEMMRLDATRHSARIHKDDLRQEQAGLFVDDDLRGGGGQMHLKLEDLRPFEGE